VRQIPSIDPKVLLVTSSRGRTLPSRVVDTWFAFAALGWLGTSLYLVFLASRIAALATPDGALVLKLVQRERVQAGRVPMSLRR
jgi:hypothetical protein